MKRGNPLSLIMFPFSPLHLTEDSPGMQESLYRVFTHQISRETSASAQLFRTRVRVCMCVRIGVCANSRVCTCIGVCAYVYRRCVCVSLAEVQGRSLICVEISGNIHRLSFTLYIFMRERSCVSAGDAWTVSRILECFGRSVPQGGLRSQL